LPDYCSRLLRIRQDESNAARLLAVIEPRVIRGLLNDDVAGLDVHRPVSSNMSISPDMMIA
jgi:hypothetical protein